VSEAVVSERMKAAEVAAGRQAATVAVRGGRVVDVYTRRIIDGDVAVAGRRIAAVGEVDHCIDSSTDVIDARRLYVVPGFLDSHIHIGGSQLTIEGLAEVLVPHGTAAICTDFYEPAVIGGKAAVTELLARARGTGLAILLSPFHAAALGFGEFGDLGRFSLDDLVDLVHEEACVEIREWNRAAASIPLEGIRRYYATALGARRVIGGHLEGLRGAELQASVALGAISDHEAGTPEEALEKTRAGVQIQIREGSGARDLQQLVRAITQYGVDPRCFALCTDEQELHSLVRDGHMDYKLRLVVREGVHPLDALRMATVNVAQLFGIEADYGSVAPGRVASLALLENLGDFRVSLTLSDGVVSSEDGAYLLSPHREPYPDVWRASVKLEKPISPETYLIDAPSLSRVRVIGVTSGSLLTEELVEEVRLEGGRLADRDSGLAKIAVIDRHEGGHRVGLGLIRGLGITQGGFAATVNPGLMNLLVVGVNEEDMALAANRVADLGGGIAVAQDGSIRAAVPLPVFGFLSDAPAAEVGHQCIDIADAIGEALGSPLDGLITTAGFACLAVSIPSLKLCDRGLVRVSRHGQEAVELVAGAEE
jgi:adenine deaminase